MSEDYVYNTIVSLLPQGVEPRCVKWRDLLDSVTSDLKVIIGNLHQQGRITGKRDINKQPLLFINENS